MFKKMYLSFALMCGMINFAMADIDPEFKSLLRNDGVMEKNTLKVTGIILKEEREPDCDESPNNYCDDEVKVSGELVLTGVLVWRPNHAVYFFPDSNIKNIFHNSKQVAECKRKQPVSECYKIKPSQSSPILIRGDEGIILKSLGASIFGRQAMRAKVYLKANGYIGYDYDGPAGVRYLKTSFGTDNFRYYDGEGAQSMSVSKIIPITPVKKVYSNYTPPSDDCSYYCFIDDIIVSMYRYTSKDNYVNIRQTPKGAIIGQIQKSDMQKPKPQRGAILGASCYKLRDEADPVDCPDVNGWYEVFYFPPGEHDGKDAIHGYIHKSQIKVD